MDDPLQSMSSLKARPCVGGTVLVALCWCHSVLVAGRLDCIRLTDTDHLRQPQLHAYVGKGLPLGQCRMQGVQVA